MAEHESPALPATANTESTPPTASPRTLPPGVHLPRPTVWPAVLASGMTLLAWGVITNYAVSAAGAALFAVAAWGWVQDLRREADGARERPEESA